MFIYISNLLFQLKCLFDICRNVKNIQKINERMLEMGVEDSHGWHKQYKDSAYIFIGNIVSCILFVRQIAVKVLPR